MKKKNNIYCTPPHDDGFHTDVDSDKSDDEHEGNLNLGRYILLSKSEIQTVTQGCEEEVCEESQVK